MANLKNKIMLGTLWNKVDNSHFDQVTTTPTFPLNREVPEGKEGITPFTFFSDGMVLQRNTCTRVFGKSDTDGGVAVEIDGGIYYGKAEQGRFEVWLPPMTAGKGKTMVIYGEKNKVTISDVCVGEVILFSGQSNMEYPMYATVTGWAPSNLSKQFLPYYKVTETAYIPSETDDPETYGEYIPSEALSARYQKDAEAEIVYDPDIRLMLVRERYPDGRSIAGNKVAREEYDYPAVWRRADDRNAILACSMFAYYFAKYLREVVDVPVGVIATGVGATETAAWVSRETFEKDPSIYSHNSESEDNPNSVSSCYNTLIAPMLPYTLGAFIWYQGEGECASNNYVAAFRALTDNYRREMDNPNLKTLVVSLPRFCMSAKFPDGFTQETYGKADARLGMSGTASSVGRANQQKIATVLDNCAVSVSLNTGDFDDIHPADKRALTWQALCRYLTAFYGFDDESLFFPEVEKVTKNEAGIKIRLKNVGSGITLTNDGIGFEVSEDGVTYKQCFATQTGKNELLLSENPSAQKIRYGYLDFPRISRIDMSKYVSVFNSYGLPLDQFEISLDNK